MVPYAKILLATCLSSLTNKERGDFLQRHNCHGAGQVLLRSFCADMVDSGCVSDEIEPLWDDESSKEERERAILYAKAVAIDLDVLDLVNTISGELDSALFDSSCRLMRSLRCYRLISALCLINYPREKIVEALHQRYAKSTTFEEIDMVRDLFLDISSMEEEDIETWIKLHDDSKTRFILRLAWYEPHNHVLDELGVVMDGGLQFTSEAIMSKSLRHFQMLSRSGHADAMKYAIDWGKLALKAAHENERSRQGNIHDFLEQFQISLLEIDDDIISDEK